MTTEQAQERINKFNERAARKAQMPKEAGKKATDEYLQLREAIFRVLGVK